MTRIATHAATKELLLQNGLWARKELGQNFLVDGFVVDKIVRAADVRAGELVIEIGPGLGGLTQALCESGADVAALEIDKRMAGVVRNILPQCIVINDDAMRVDIPQIATELGYSCFKIVANLPYYITTPLIMKMLEHEYAQGQARMLSATLMMQREVADRISAQPGTKGYGALSLGVAYRAGVSLVANVPRNCFLPRPSVDSAVVHLVPHTVAPVSVEDEGLMFSIIKAAFGMRRKTLLNCMAHKYDRTKDEISRIISLSGVSPQARAETLGLDEYARLANEFQGIV